MVQLSHPYVTTDTYIHTHNMPCAVLSHSPIRLSETLRTVDHRIHITLYSSSVESLSSVQLFETPWTVAHQASLSITNSRSLLKPMAIELVMPSNYHILCPLLLLPSIFLSIMVFSNVSPLHQVVKILELHLRFQSFQ